MVKRKSVARRAILLAAVLAAGAVFALRTDAAGDQVCSVLRRELPKRAGVDIGIGQCRLDPLTQTVKLSGISVFAPDSDEIILAAEEADVSVRSVFFGSVALGDVKLSRPRVTLDLSKPSPQKSTGKKTCPMQILGRVRIDRLSIKGAQVDLQLPAGRSLSLEGLDVDWTTRRGVMSPSISLKGGHADLGGGHAGRLGPALIEAEVDVDDESISLQRADLSFEGVTLQLTGTLEALCDESPRLGLNAQVFVPVSTATKLISGTMQGSGNIWSRLSVTGKTSSPVVKAEVQGSEVVLATAKPGDFTARIGWSGTDVLLEELTTKAGSGTVKVSGSVKLEPGYPVRAKVDTVDASLGHILARAGMPGAWVDMPATAKINVSGTLFPKFQLQGEADIKSGRFTLANRPYDQPDAPGAQILTFPQGRAELHVGVFPDRVAMTNIRAQVGHTFDTRVKGDVTLHFDQEKGLEIHADGEHLALADFGHIAGLPWAGQGTAQVTIAGPYKKVLIEGQMAMHDFELMGYAMGVVSSPLSFRSDVGTLSFESVNGQKGRTQYFGRIDLGFKHDVHVTAAVQVPKGRTEDLIDVIAGLSPSTLGSFQNGTLTGDITASAKIDSPAKLLTGTMQLDFKDTRYYGRRLGDGQGMARFDHGDALVVDSLKLNGPLGSTAVAGRWTFTGPLAFDAAIDNGAMAELIGPTTGLSGPFRMKARIEGDTNTPVVHATLTSAQLAVKGAAVGPTNLKAELLGKALTVTGAFMNGVHGDGHLTIKDPYPYEATLAVQIDDLKPFMPATLARQGLTSSASGTLKIAGDLRGFDYFSLDANLDKFALSRGDFSATNDGPVQLSWAAGKLTLASFAVKGTNTELSASGSWGPTTADLKARGEADLRLFESFVPQVERVAGRIDLTTTVTGPVKDPTIVGNAEVHDARFQVKNQALAVKALSGRMEFSKARVLLQGFEGFLNDGRVDVRGDIRLAGTDLKQLEIAVDIDQVTVQPKPEFPATVTGSLLFYGKPDAYQLSGGLEITRFRYTQRLELDTLLANARNSSLLVSDSEEQPAEWLRFDVDLEAGNDVQIDNSLARAKLSGKVKLAGTNTHPQLLGSISANEGSQAFFRGNVFNIGRAVMQLNGLVPTFDLTAQTQAREYLVNVKGFGRLDDPRVSFNSQPPLSESDILSLLTLGVTSKEQVSGTAGASLAAEALLSATGLDAQVQRFLTKSVGIKDSQVHLSTTFNPASGKAEPSVSWESKVLSDKLKVGVTQPVTGRGTRAQAEYRFNDRVSLRAQWDNQTDTSSFGNPGLDLKFRFEWE